jgi:hypothetical protein
MTADQVFSIANMFALLGWIVLAFGVARNMDFIRDSIAGLWMPLGLSVLYGLLIVFFFGRTEGGFDTLEHVQQLFTSPWVALAGWVHYLAFDLFIGARIARGVMDRGINRLVLILLLPLTFMFGPIGLVAYEFVKIGFGKRGV